MEKKRSHTDIAADSPTTAAAAAIRETEKKETRVYNTHLYIKTNTHTKYIRAQFRM